MVVAHRIGWQGQNAKSVGRRSVSREVCSLNSVVRGWGMMLSWESWQCRDINANDAIQEVFPQGVWESLCS